MQALEEIQPVPFGTYLLLERFAMGGMAEVFIARPRGQDRLVAVKRILPNVAADDEFIAMFIDEAKIAGQLNHPNVAQIIEIGKIDNIYFIAMEYVSGHDVRALWDRTREAARAAGDAVRGLPIGIACHIVKKLAEGLDYAHRRRDGKGRPLGIIHRDVSPQNLLISYEGDLKIIDFGIAKAADRLVKTQTGILKGKFAYMAPEQARGEPIDHRSDVFAIGVVLYELLTGERAFKGDTDFALLEKVRRVDVVPPRQLRPDLPRELERIVLKAMSKDAGDRYAWASLLADDLDRFLSDQGITTSREELGAFVRRTFRDEYLDEQRRLAVYRRRSDARGESGRVDGSGATVVRGGPSARNGRPGRASGEGAAPQAGAVGDVLDEPKPDTKKSLRRPRPTTTAEERKAGAPRRSDARADLVALRDQAIAVARGAASEIDAAPSSSAAPPTAVGPTVRSDGGAQVRDDASDVAPPPSPASSSPSTFGEPAPSLSPSTQREPSGRVGNGVIVVACLLGAVLGAGLAVGIAFATRAPLPDTLVVTLPRQTEVRLGDTALCAQTPCAVHLGRGRHELSLQAPGAPPVTHVVEVGDGPAVVDVTLERIARAVRIDTTPPGAIVVLDDVPLPEPTPTTLPPIPVGRSVQLVLSRDGFEPLAVTRVVEGDAVWRFDMPTTTTTWEITATPADALLDAGAREGTGRVVVAVGRKPITVKVARPGCDPQTVTISATGKAAAARAVTLSCREFDGRLSVQAPRRPVQVRIDGVTVAKGANLDGYPLPAGTWNVALTSPRGRKDVQTVEVRRGETTLLLSRVR